MNTKTLTKKQEANSQMAISAAYDEYRKDLNSYAFFKTNSREMSDDLVQDTFIKTWKYLAKNGKIDSMKAFLYHILRHLIVDEYRKNKPTSLDLLLEKGFEPILSRDHERIVDVIDGKGAIILIARLPKTYQKVMRMRFVQELSLSEISLLTGQTRNAVAVQVHRGLVKLKVLYKNSRLRRKKRD